MMDASVLPVWAALLVSVLVLAGAVFMMVKGLTE